MTDDPTARLEAAERHLATLRERGRQLDARGSALADELERTPPLVGKAALDAIEREAKKPILAALRKRLAALPGQIEAVAAERAGLAREIAAAQTELEHAELADAATTALRLGEERRALAGQIDAALQQLAEVADRFMASGQGLQHAFHTLGIKADAGAYDDVVLACALKAASPRLAVAFGVPKNRRFVTGDLREVLHTDGWAEQPSASAAGAEENVRQLLLSAVEKLRDAA